MFPGETVNTGAPHPGTQLQVLSTPAGYYLGYLDKEGFPYSRETGYMTKEQAEQALDEVEKGCGEHHFRT